MLWGCFTAADLERLVKIKGTLNVAKYAKILKDSLIHWRRFFFQQGNDPKSTLKATEKWFEDNMVSSGVANSVLEWQVNYFISIQ